MHYVGDKKKYVWGHMYIPFFFFFFKELHFVGNIIFGKIETRMTASSLIYIHWLCFVLINSII